MSPIRTGSRTVIAVSAQVLGEQAGALGDALALSAFDLEPAAVDHVCGARIDARATR